MTQPTIEQLLNELRAELARLDATNGGGRQRLEALADRIETQIEQDLAVDNQNALMDELNDELVEFEVEHPTAAGLLQNLIRMLGNIGV